MFMSKLFQLKLVARPVTLLNHYGPLAQFRSFQTSSLVLKAATTTKSAKAARVKQLQTLKDQLAKEKKTYKKLKDSVKAAEKKASDKKKQEKAKEAKLREKAKNSKLMDRAFKTNKRIAGFSMYLKEKGGNIAENSKSWSQLSAGEKEQYDIKAQSYNDEQAQIYKPKPKAPSNKFAAFVRENYVRDGRETTEVMKDLAKQWGTLTDSEKDAYGATAADKAAYQNQLKSWKAERIKIFNEKHGTHLTL